MSFDTPDVKQQSLNRVIFDHKHDIACLLRSGGLVSTIHNVRDHSQATAFTGHGMLLKQSCKMKTR